MMRVWDSEHRKQSRLYNECDPKYSLNLLDEIIELAKHIRLSNTQRTELGNGPPKFVN